MKKYAIIVAGGTGSRMRSDVPKQFLLVDGVPIIVKTIRRFKEADAAIQLIVVLPEAHFDYWNKLAADFPITSEVITTFGGATRTESVRSGMSRIDDDGLVAIHDAVRPFVSTETIIASYISAEKNGSGVTAVPMKDSIRELVENNQSIARDRSKFVLVQTPQTFRVKELKEAYQQVLNQPFTDDASVFEAAGKTVCLVEGTYSNIKITTPDDLK